MKEQEPAVNRPENAMTKKIWALSRTYGLQPIHRILLGHDGSMT
ncbi:hypothetical protein C5S31_00360, partial [ANME-1 cluster archaeon GoMg2]|nr:hypothetical protein [ANME-1 cluster archaeon GoMg2]